MFFWVWGLRGLRGLSLLRNSSIGRVLGGPTAPCFETQNREAVEEEVRKSIMLEIEATPAAANNLMRPTIASEKRPPLPERAPASARGRGERRDSDVRPSSRPPLPRPSSGSATGQRLGPGSCATTPAVKLAKAQTAHTSCAADEHPSVSEPANQAMQAGSAADARGPAKSSSSAYTTCQEDESCRSVAPVRLGAAVTQATDETGVENPPPSATRPPQSRSLSQHTSSTVQEPTGKTDAAAAADGSGAEADPAHSQEEAVLPNDRKIGNPDNADTTALPRNVGKPLSFPTRDSHVSNASAPKPSSDSHPNQAKNASRPPVPPIPQTAKTLQSAIANSNNSQLLHLTQSNASTFTAKLNSRVASLAADGACGVDVAADGNCDAASEVAECKVAVDAKALSAGGNLFSNGAFENAGAQRHDDAANSEIPINCARFQRQQHIAKSPERSLRKHWRPTSRDCSH